MDRKTRRFSTLAIKINQTSYRQSIQGMHFFRYLLFVFLKGESPIQHRPGYARRSRIG